jgi:glycosyltransferase involved in cell wall biosynthesis
LEPAQPVADASTPRVSIGLPVFNGAKYLESSLDSLLSQTFSDFELVVTDNASDDATPAICARYAERDPRLRYERNEVNIGGFANHNLVAKLARGEFFLWAGHDDLREPTYLERCVAALDGRPGAVLCYTQTVVIDELGKPTGYRERHLDADQPDPAARFRELIRLDYRLEPIYGLIRRDELMQTALQRDYPDSDRVLLAELGLHGRFVCLPEPLFLRRDHPERSIRRFPSRQERARWIDPTGRTRITFPHHRQLGELLRAIGRAPVPRKIRLRCYAYTAVWAGRYRRRLWSDVDFVLRRQLRPVVRRIRPHHG